MSKSIEAIMDLFPYSIIVKVEDEPNYYLIKEVEKKLMHNAASIPAELGGGNHSFLGLVLTPQKYTTITEQIFTPHINPGTFPQFLQNPIQPIITEISAIHKEVLKAWRKQTAVIKYLKNQLINVFKDKYLEEIIDTYVVYNNRSIQDIIAYLYD